MTYNKKDFESLFSQINTSGSSYFSGPRFIKVIQEYVTFPNYLDYMEYLKNNGCSTSRKDYFFQILSDLDEDIRNKIITHIFKDVGIHGSASSSLSANINLNVQYDAFICHASEDKEVIARPIYHKLKEKGYNVFFDEMSIEWGDSLIDKINSGIASSRFGIIILSPNFIRKQWTQAELKGFFNRQINGENIILPILHNISIEEIKVKYPLLGDILALDSSLIHDIISGFDRKMKADINISKNHFIENETKRGMSESQKANFSKIISKIRTETYS